MEQSRIEEVLAPLVLVSALLHRGSGLYSYVMKKYTQHLVISSMNISMSVRCKFNFDGVSRFTD